MTLVEAENYSNGPAKLDISIEQEADFQTPPFQILINGVPWTTVVLTAWLTLTWNPPLTLKIPMTPTILDGVNMWVNVGLTAAQTALILAQQPTPSKPGPRGSPRSVRLGGWVLYGEDSTYGLNRLLNGDVFLDRDPSQ